MRCDVLAQGVVEAAKEIKINVPLVVRLAGTNFMEGKKILGIVSVGDVVNHVIEQYKDENKHLKDYMNL